jgi:hypothetical protein
MKIHKAAVRRGNRRIAAGNTLVDSFHDVDLKPRGNLIGSVLIAALLGLVFFLGVWALENSEKF